MSLSRVVSCIVRYSEFYYYLAFFESCSEIVCFKRRVRCRRCTLHIERVSVDPPAKSSNEVMDAIEKSTSEAGTRYKHMVSRAYHDSLFMAQIVPTAMIFIPCAGGRSHRPDEFASPRDIEMGAKVLASTMAKLSQTVQGDHMKDEL